MTQFLLMQNHRKGNFARYFSLDDKDLCDYHPAKIRGLCTAREARERDRERERARARVQSLNSFRL